MLFNIIETAIYISSGEGGGLLWPCIINIKTVVLGCAFFKGGGADFAHFHYLYGFFFMSAKQIHQKLRGPRLLVTYIRGGHPHSGRPDWNHGLEGEGGGGERREERFLA